MISVLRNTSFTFLLVVSSVWGVTSLFVGERYQYPTTADGCTTRPAFDDLSVADQAVPRNSYLASRHHLRNQGTRSFNRVADLGQERESSHNAKLEAIAPFSESVHLAARYHLRNRTSRFFERSTKSGQKSKSRHNSTGKLFVPTSTEQEGRQWA